MTGIFHTVTIQEIAHWPTPPNYDNPPELRTWLAPYAIVWACISTALISVRIVVRVQNRAGSFGLDDIFIIVAWVFAIAFTATACVSIWDLSIGRHIWNVRPEHYEGALYLGWLAQVMFLHSTCATKTSVLLFYHRMVKDTYSKAWLYTVWILLFITVGSWIGFFITYCFMCQPLHLFWTYIFDAEWDPKCISGSDLTIAVGVLTIASDFWTAALPCTLFQYHDLGVSKRQKIGLNIIFCLGFLVTGVGIARTYYLWQIHENQDISWIGYNLFATSIAEIELGLICTCAPFLRALFRKYGNRMSYIQRSSGGGTGDHISVHRSGARASFVGVTPLRNIERSPMRDVEEKQGCLVREEGTGRLVWSAKGSRASISSPTSVFPLTEQPSPKLTRSSAGSEELPTSPASGKWSLGVPPLKRPSSESPDEIV